MRYGRLSEDGEVAQSHGENLPIPASEPPQNLLPVVYSGPADDNTQVCFPNIPLNPVSIVEAGFGTFDNIPGCFPVLVPDSPIAKELQS